MKKIAASKRQPVEHISPAMNICSGFVRTCL
jgi:hypothetical protein